jgi:hypothetical protein
MTAAPQPQLPSPDTLTAVVRCLHFAAVFNSATRVASDPRGARMRIALFAIAAAAALAAGGAFAEPVRDWHDLDKVHQHVQESIHEMERARAANHYDMAGHGAKAEDLLRQAERELHAAVESAKAAH